MVKRILLGLLGGIVFIFFCNVAELQAQVAPHLVISEVQVGENKFIKLHNPTEIDTDISGWSMQYRGLSGSSYSRKNFEQGDIILAQGFFNVQKDECALDNLLCMRWSSFPLAASGGNVFLVSDHNYIESDEDDSIIDKKIYGFPISDDPEIKLPDIHAGEVAINEIVSNPSDGAEWVEFYNNTTSTINLTGCKIYDGTESAVLSLGGNIAGQGFFVAELSSARLLNNTGDLVILKNAYDVIIDQVAYGSWDDGNVADNAPNPSAGQSVARKSNGVDTNHDNADFAVSDQVTYGTSNIIHATTTKIQGGTNASANFGTVPLPKIVINEFAVGSEKESEWVELYIGGEVSMDLDGWYLENGAENKTSLTGVLIPGQFKVIEKINGALNSKGDIIRLKNKNDEVHDSVSYGVWEDGKPSDNAPVAQSPFSIARVKDGVDTNNDKKDFKATSAATKGNVNKIEKIEVDILGGSTSKPLEVEPPSVVGVVGKLFINEIMPNPIGSDSEEWVELRWIGNEELNLQGLKIDDNEEGSVLFTFKDLMVKPDEYVLIKRELTKIALNNDTDEVRLIDQQGNIIDIVEYEDAEEGNSYAKKLDGSWAWTIEPTPQKENIIKQAAPEREFQYVAIKDVRDLDLNKNVIVKGVVSVPPGVLGSQFFYIVGSGVQIYSNKKLFPNISVGDTVQVMGTTSQSQGETRIKTKELGDIRIISKGEPPMPHDFTPELANEEIQGSLVKLQGTIIDISSSGFVIDTGFDEVLVSIKKSTGISIKGITPGFQVAVTGVVVSPTAGYRLLPRFQEDIEIVGMNELVVSEKKEEKNIPYAQATAYAVAIAGFSILGIRRKEVFVNGFKAALFMVKNRGKGVI